MSERRIRRARERVSERDQRNALRPSRRTQASLITGATMAGSAVLAAAAQAEPPVNTLADPGLDGTCDAYVQGVSDCSLREAINYENDVSNPGDNIVEFASGLSGAIHLTQGDIDIVNESLTIDGPGEPGNEVITIDAGHDSRIFKIFGFDSPTEEVVISGLTLRHGLVEGEHGGAISNTAFSQGPRGGAGPYAASLTIADSVITDNTARSLYANESLYGGIGGAIYHNQQDAIDTLTITNTVINDNFADLAGGGVASGGTTVDIEGSRIVDNTVFDGAGGGLALYGAPPGDTGPSIEITDSTVNRNAAGQYFGEGGPSFYVTGGGGMVLAFNEGETVIEQTTIADNETFQTDPDDEVPDFVHGDGGGILFEPRPNNIERGIPGGGGGLRISESTLSGNYAGPEGGGLSVGAPGGPVLVDNSTFSNNAAYFVGGGMSVYNPYAVPVTIENSTVTDNELNPFESAGGGIYLDEEDLIPRGGGYDGAELSSTIVAENYAAFGPDLAADEGVFYTDFSLIGLYDPNFAQIDDDGTSLIGDEEDPIDPQLLPLGDHGGPTETHLPGATSPVLDQGTSNGYTNDQRLLDRTFDDPAIANADDGTDIGAVEVQGEEPPPEEPPPPGGGVGGDVFEGCLGNNARVVSGTAGNDDLVGTFTHDVIRALAGDDRLRAIEGRDCLFGDEGNDLAKGGGAVDLVDGGAGNDRLKGQGGGDTLIGGDDNDNVNGDDGKDDIDTGAGSDKVGGNQGNDTIDAGSGNDRIRLGVGRDKGKGGSGNDRIGAVDALKDKVKCGGGDDRAVVDPIDRVSASCEEVVVVQAEN